MATEHGQAFLAGLPSKLRIFLLEEEQSNAEDLRDRFLNQDKLLEWLTVQTNLATILKDTSPEESQGIMQEMTDLASWLTFDNQRILLDNTIELVS